MTSDRWLRLRQSLTWHRRLVAAVLAGLAVLLGLQAVRPSPPPTVDVLVAARDVAPGATLTPDDLAVAAYPVGLVPATALGPDASVTGRAVAAPLASGEPITEARLVGPSLVGELSAGSVATPVRVADAGSVALVRAGDRVDLLATPVGLAGEPPVAHTIADDVLVLAVPVEADGAYGATDGALVLVATTASQAVALAGAAVTSRLALTIRP